MGGGGGTGQKVCLLHNAHLKGEFARLLPLSRENGPSSVFNLKGKDPNLEVILPKDEIEDCLEDSNLTELKADNICLKL